MFSTHNNSRFSAGSVGFVDREFPINYLAEPSSASSLNTPPFPPKSCEKPHHYSSLTPVVSPQSGKNLEKEGNSFPFFRESLS
jgi:hypothetical protein